MSPASLIVVRRPEWPRAHQPARSIEHARDAVDARRLDGLIERHRRQNRGNALREHRLARARRPDQQNVVAPRAGDLHSPLGRHLPAHVAQIHGVAARFREHLGRVHANWLERFRRVDEIGRLDQRFHCEHVDALDDSRFPRVHFGHDDASHSALPRGDGRGKRAAHRTHAAVERQLSKKHVRIRYLAVEQTLAAQEPQRHRQIECRTFLANISGREIYGDALRRGKIEAAILQRRLDPLAALLDGHIGQPDHVELAHLSRADVDFDLDGIGIDSKYSRAERFE